MCIVYNLPLIATENVYDFMADSMKKQCRKIDIIKMKNSEKPIDLYSLDVTNANYADKDQEISERVNFDIENTDLVDYRTFHCRIKEKIQERLIKGAKNSVFFEDPDIQMLFKKKFEFKRACRKAIDFYSLGAWDLCKKELD